MASGEITYASALANPLLRIKLRPFVSSIKWNSELASKTVKYFETRVEPGKLPEMADLRSFLSNGHLNDEVQQVLNAVKDFVLLSEDKHPGVIADFEQFYAEKSLTDIFEKNDLNASHIVDQVRSIPIIKSAGLPCVTLGNLTVDEVMKEEINDMDILPSSFKFIQKATPWGGYLRGQLVMIVAPPGVGKSLFILNEVLEMLKAGQKVYWCFTGDTEVMTLDHGKKSLEQMYQDGDTNIGVYSCTPDGDVKVSVAKEVKLMGYRDELIEVEIDGDTKVKCTPDHKWMMTDGTYKEAKDLNKFDSLMPVTRKISDSKYLNPDRPGKSFLTDKGYEYVVNLKGDRTLTHKLSGNYLRLKNPDMVGEIDHHRIDENGNANKLDNHPDSIQVVNPSEHAKIHMENRWKFDKKFREKALISIKKCWENPEFRKQHSARLSERNIKNWEDPEYVKFMEKAGILSYNGSEEQKEMLKELWSSDKHREKMAPVLGSSRLYSSLKYLKHLITERILTSSEQLTEDFYNSNRNLAEGTVLKSLKTLPVWKNVIKHFSDVDELFESALNYNNHTITKVTRITLDEPVPVYDLIEVDMYHNFTISTGNNTGVVVSNCALGDMMKIDFMTRISSLYHQIPFAEVSLNVKKYYTEEVAELCKNLRLTVLPADSVDIMTISDFVESSVAAEDDIDCLVLDYDANLQDTVADNLYAQGRQVYNTMAKLCRPRGKKYRLGMIASQPKPQFWDQEELPKQCANESSGKQAVVDIMITIGKHPNIVDKHAGVMMAAKVRRGDEGVRAYYQRTSYGVLSEIERSSYQMMQKHIG